MLDVKLLSITAAVPNMTENVPKALLLRACKVHVFGNGRIYSELEEQTFDSLNDNKGFGVLDIELVFGREVVKKSFPKFYTKCFVIRTDTNVIIKPMKFSNESNYSKLNQNGEIVIGIRYFFKDNEEINKLVSCQKILVEGFIALSKPTNVFGVMCQLQKEDSDWIISSAYTYKPKYAKNIKRLID